MRDRARARHAGDALSDELSEIERPRQGLRAHHDGRFSGGTSGLSIGHVSPEAAEGGLIALVKTGDRIEIDIPRAASRWR